MAAFDTTYPADTVEFCPHLNALDIFTCGTYKLDGPPTTPASELVESVTQDRRGQCLLFQVDPAFDQGFRHIQTLNFPAIPDTKWCHRSQTASPLLGVADSEGCITLLELHESERILKEANRIRCAPPDTLCLSLDWSNRRTPGTNLGNLIVSLSSGSLCLLHPGDGGGLTLAESWQAHDYEAWVGAWDYWDTNVVYSGGDDSRLKGWDIRQNLQQSPLINRRFDAGITSIQSHPHMEHMFAVGSYDDTVRLFDMRNPLIPLTEVGVGGGAWRVKWHPSSSRKDDLLVACMHDGLKIVRFSSGEVETSGEVVKRYDAHNSLAYGADWSFGSPRDDDTLIGSCSFYDHAFYLWSG